MLRKLILIENGKSYQFDSKEELVKYLMGNNYYSLSDEEKRNQLKLNALAKCINNALEIYDEQTYILSLLLTNRVTLLESIDSNIFTKGLDKEKIKNNYIIVNTFAKELLDTYLNA